MQLTIEQAFRKAIEAHKGGQLQEAHLIYEEILRAHPKHADANHNIGVLLASSNRSKEALQYFQIALKTKPKMLQYWLSYIDTLIGLGQQTDAHYAIEKARKSGISGVDFDKLVRRSTLEELAKVNAGYIDPLPDDTKQKLMKLYNNYLYDNLVEKSLELKKSIGASVALCSIQAAAYIELKEFDRAVLCYKEVLKINPNLFDTLCNLSIAYNRKGDLKNALVSSRRAIKVNPNYADAYFQLGNALLENNELNEAISSFSRVIELKHEHSDAHFNLAIAQTRTGDTASALESYKKSVVIKPNYFQAFNNMGMIFKQIGNIKAAKANYEKAIELQPKFADAYYNLANLLKYDGKTDAAIEQYQKALKISPNHSKIHNNLGNAFKENRATEAAIKSYRKAIKYKPDYFTAYNNLGLAQNENGQRKDALDSFNTALQINPKYADTLYNIANLQKEDGNLEKAIENYQTAIRIDPNVAEFHNNLGVALMDYGNTSAAWDAYLKALELQPDNDIYLKTVITQLTNHPAPKRSTNPLILSHELISQIQDQRSHDTKITDDEILNFYAACQKITLSHSISNWIPLSQIYRRNSINLNCARHFAIFNESKIIPRFCFDCYKVQIQPHNVMDLIKLHMIFDQVQLPKNNTRKCMVELRPNISGFYKGLIYCSSEHEAEIIKKKMELIITEKISPKIDVTVKRGCSEYAITFPNYADIKQQKGPVLRYDKTWQKLEQKYDQLQNTPLPKAFPSKNGHSLCDFLIIENWLCYANLIGDSTVQAFENKQGGHPSISVQVRLRGEYIYQNDDRKFS